MSGAPNHAQIIGADDLADDEIGWDDDLPGGASDPAARASLRQITVPQASHGQRLDKALAQCLPELSRNLIQQLIDSDAVQVDGQRPQRAAVKVRVGQRIELRLDLAPQNQAFEPEAMPLVVVHEDADLLVIDKPAGLVVHPAPGHWSGTLLNGLLAHHEGARRLPRAGIVHRLDKDTSGLMVVAKSRPAMEALVNAIAARQVQREYLALVHKAWLGPQVLSVEQAIGRDARQRVRMAVVDLARQAGKPARTDVHLLASQAAASLVLCRLHTGRTHQIRVHLRHLGHSLIGDVLYGGRVLAGMQRQALHAWRLALTHPMTGQPLHWQSPWPQDMAEAAQALGLQPVVGPQGPVQAVG